MTVLIFEHTQSLLMICKKQAVSRRRKSMQRIFQKTRRSKDIRFLNISRNFEFPRKPCFRGNNFQYDRRGDRGDPGGCAYYETDTTTWRNHHDTERTSEENKQMLLQAGHSKKGFHFYDSETNAQFNTTLGQENRDNATDTMNSIASNTSETSTLPSNSSSKGRRKNRRTQPQFWCHSKFCLKMYQESTVPISTQSLRKECEGKCKSSEEKANPNMTPWLPVLNLCDCIWNVKRSERRQRSSEHQESMSQKVHFTEELQEGL